MYFSGFCFHNEEALFESFVPKRGAYHLCGFSYGAQKAMEEALHRVSNSHRVNRLVLLSPAIFQDKSLAYHRLQLKAFENNPQSYRANFFSTAGVDENISPYTTQGSLFELKELLGYIWEKDKLQRLLSYGVDIEVYLGENDKIINPQYAFEFFTPYARVFLIKKANHCLRIKS